MKVSGKGVWQAFQHETGKHVVQRVPPTERNGRRQTSVISVVVLPLPPSNFRSKSLPENELDIKTQCGGGPGGQHTNKSATSVRIVHRPTGLQVFLMGRSQHANMQDAKEILAAKVNEFRNREQSEAYNSHREKQMKGGGKMGGRGEKVRTYNFIQSRVVDHRLGLKTSNVKEVMKGNLDVLFSSTEKGE